MFSWQMINQQYTWKYANWNWNSNSNTKSNSNSNTHIRILIQPHSHTHSLLVYLNNTFQRTTLHLFIKLLHRTSIAPPSISLSFTPTHITSLTVAEPTLHYSRLRYNAPIPNGPSPRTSFLILHGSNDTFLVSKRDTKEKGCCILIWNKPISLSNNVIYYYYHLQPASFFTYLYAATDPMKIQRSLGRVGASRISEFKKCTNVR